MTQWLWNGPESASTVLVLAHGAGAPMDTPFMDAFAEGVAAAGCRVLRFEFPYMRRRRTEGVKAGPNRQPALERAFIEACGQVPASARLLVGGKSMGGRIASYVANDLGAAGVIALGYPFHPVGKPEKTRVDHFPTLQAPMLIVQGERDPFGRPEEVASYGLPASVEVRWVSDGDHSLKPRKRSGLTQEENWATGVSFIAQFLEGL